MPYFENTDDKFKLIVAKHLYLVPGDYNYINARFCRIVGLHREFAWQCLQALEKYFKASLVLNGRPAVDFRHDLVKLLSAHREVYGEHAVTDPVRPDVLSERLWKARSLDYLVEWIGYFGHPDSRYGLRSYSNDPSDLFLFDDFVFQLRRRIGRLESVVGTDIYLDGENRVDELEQSKGQTFSYIINAHPKFQLFNMNIPKVTFADAGGSLEDALYSWNFPWSRSPKDYEKHAPRTVSAESGGFGNSLINHLIDAMARQNPDEERVERIRRCIGWLVDNVPMEKSVKTEILSRRPARA